MTTSHAFRFIDLFAGIGGFHLGLARAGGQCVFVCEVEEAARSTYERNFRESCPELFACSERFARDIADVHPEDVPRYDIVTAGFPCQPFSYAGKRGGFMDRRGVQFYQLARLVMHTQPPAYIFENVPGLRGHQHGITFAAIRETMTTQLGYSFHTAVLRARDFGVPQLRPRLFMVGFRDPSTPFSFPEPIPLRTTLSDVLGGECDRDVSRTVLASGMGGRVGQRRNWDAYLVDGKQHRLTIDEIRQLQGFPPSYVLPENRRQAIALLGNAVAVPVVEAVGRQVVASLTAGSERRHD